MEFTQRKDKIWKAQINFKELCFWGYGMTKQEAGSKCMENMQEYIDEMQTALNEEIR